MGQKVYVVTDGCYSDISVVGVFSTMEAAKSFCDRCLSYSSIDEFTLDDEEMTSGLNPYCVEMDEDGNNAVARSTDWSGSDSTFVHPYWRVVRLSNEPLTAQTPVVVVIRTCVRARDEEHAIKIANERRAAWLANNRRDP